jgi:DNA processing protein
MSDNILTILALSRLPKVGRVRLRRVLEALSTNVLVTLNFDELVERFADQIPAQTEATLGKARAEAADLMERCQTLGVSVHPFGWPSYPQQLCRLAEPPAMLFSLGRFEPNKKPRVAVIGTRKPTDWGLETAKACASQIADSRGVVVSGLALGIDAAAQQASVERLGANWAVLAHGLHMVSPSSSRPLAKEIVDTGGALLSEYPPGEPAQRHYFVERDRIQAGLADAVLVIESGIDGGSMHTVRFAEQAKVAVWVTFPDAKLRLAGTASADLPEPQQGTWDLLTNHRAKRVTSAKWLTKLMDELTTGSAVPDAPLSL